MAQGSKQVDREVSRARMLIRQRPQLLFICLIGACLLCLAIVLGVSFAGARSQTLIERADVDTSSATERSDKDSGAAEAEQSEKIVVDVSGAVTSPGVYELEVGSRISDAIDAAGGLTPDADVSTLNRASKVSDGMKVTVPEQGQAESSGVSEGGGSASAQSAGAASGLVNINTATLDELQSLSGVGPSTAQAIIDDREQNGLFTSTEDLMRVSGIGEKKFAKIQNAICV